MSNPALASPPWPSSPPIFFTPAYAPSPSPIAAVVANDTSRLPEAAIVGSGVAGAVVASAVVTAIASKMGCSLLGPLFSVISFIFKNFLGIKGCPDILKFRGRRGRGLGKGIIGDDDEGEYSNAHHSRGDCRRNYDRDDSSRNYNRNSLVSPSSAQYSRRHRYRDGNHEDVAIDVWDELEATRKHVQDQANDVGYMLRPTKSNISKFAAAEMRKLEGLHDAALLQINKNIINESHDRIQSVSVSVGQFEVDQERLMKVSVGTCSEAIIDSGTQLAMEGAAVAAQMQHVRAHETTQQVQLLGIANDGTSAVANQNSHHQIAIDIDKQEQPQQQHPSVGNVNVSDGHSNPSAQDAAAAAAAASQHLPNGTTAVAAADLPRQTTDGRILLDMQRGQSQDAVHSHPPNPKPHFRVQPASSPSIPSPGIHYYARDPLPRLNSNELQLVPSTTPAAVSGRRRARAHHDTTTDDRHRVPPTRDGRKSSKRRRLSRVAGVRVSCELSAHFMKFFVFCKSGTNYGDDRDNNNKQQEQQGLQIEDEDKENLDTNEITNLRRHKAADSVSSLPYVVHLPADHSGPLAVPPSLQFYQPSPWQTYPAPQAAAIFAAGGGANANAGAAFYGANANAATAPYGANINTAGASNITPGGYPHSSSAASSSAVNISTVLPSNSESSMVAAAPSETVVAGIGNRYGRNYYNSSTPTSYQLIPVINASGNYVISSGGNFAKVAVMTTPAAIPHHHVTISDTVVSSETNSLSDKDDVPEALATSTTTLMNPATGNTLSHPPSESKSTTSTALPRHEFGNPYYGA